jgi:threonine/homoserine efflux transporter RhtA
VVVLVTPRMGVTDWMTILSGVVISVTAFPLHGPSSFSVVRLDVLVSMLVSLLREWHLELFMDAICPLIVVT